MMQYKGELFVASKHSKNGGYWEGCGFICSTKEEAEKAIKQSLEINLEGIKMSGVPYQNITETRIVARDVPDWEIVERKKVVHA